jgi:hypothetical protein
MGFGLGIVVTGLSQIVTTIIAKTKKKTKLRGL